MYVPPAVYYKCYRNCLFHHICEGVTCLQGSVEIKSLDLNPSHPLQAAILLVVTN